MAAGALSAYMLLGRDDGALPESGAAAVDEPERAHSAVGPTVEAGPFEISIEASVSLPPDLAEGAPEREFEGEGVFDPEAGASAITFDWGTIPNGFSSLGHVDEVDVVYTGEDYLATFDGLERFTRGAEWMGFTLTAFYEPPGSASDEGQLRELAFVDPSFALDLLHGLDGTSSTLQDAAEISGSKILAFLSSELGIKEIQLQVQTDDSNVVRTLSYEIRYPPALKDNPDVTLDVEMTFEKADEANVAEPRRSDVLDWPDFVTHSF